MKINLKEAILASKNLKLYVPFQDEFEKYSQMYFSTTELVNNYMSNINYNKNSALTVIASGDQILNLIYQGVKYIDAFDINTLTYFNYELKVALIKTLSFKEWEKYNKNNFYFKNKRKFNKVLKKIKIELPEIVYEYFMTLINDKDFLDLSDLYTKNRTFFNKNSNLYGNDIESYNKTKENLKNCEVNLYFGNATDIFKELKHKYDIIILSNIWDYLGINKKITIKEIKEFIKNYQDLLNDEGIIITYFYGLKKDYIIYNSLVTKEELDIYEIHPITVHEGYYVIRK